VLVCFTYQNVLVEFPTSFFYAHFGLVKFYFIVFKAEFSRFLFFLNYVFGLSFCIIFSSNFSTIRGSSSTGELEMLG
jgi:hypothetical protein